MPGTVSHSTTVAPPRSPEVPRLKNAFSRICFDNVKNGPSPVVCGLPYTRGDFERMSHADAKNVAVEVMRAGLSSVKGSDADALRRMIVLATTPGGIGHILEEHLTALGATRASLAFARQENSDNQRLAKLEAKLDVAVRNIGVAAGNCKGIPEAATTTKSSGLLSAAVRTGKEVMVKCANELGADQFLAGVSGAVLPRALKNDMAERVPNLAGRFDGSKGAPELTRLFQTQAAVKLDRLLARQLEAGTPESITSAILNLLKAPEYMKQGDPGKADDTPEAPTRDNAPRLPPELLRTGSGAPVLYNNNQAAPITIKNEGSHTFSLTDLRNLVNESFDRGYSLGASHRETTQLRAENTALRKQNADLMEMLRKDNQRLSLFAKGPDLVRVPGGASEDEVDTTVQKQDTPPPSDDRNPRFALDPDSPRAPRVPDVNRQQNQLNRQENLNRQDNEQRSDQQLNRADNGAGGPRNPTQDNDADSQNRLGGTQQLDQRQRDEQNRYLQQDDGSNRSGGLGVDGSDTHYAEFKGFLQAAEYEERIEPRDKFEPPTERRKDPDVVNASQVAKYVKERSAKAGTPFVPTMKGSLLPPVQLSPGRVRELIQELGGGGFVPSEIAEKEGTVGLKKSAPATLPAKSPLQEGMEAFFQKRDLALLELAQSRPSVQAQPASAVLGERRTFQSFLDTLPSTPVPARGVLNRSDSLASIASNESDASETGSELGKRIFSASRQSRATLPPRAGHGPLNAPAAGLTPLALLARSIPSAPIVETAVRSHAASPASPGSANGQRLDVLRRDIVDDSRIPRGERERAMGFSIPRDPPESIDPDAAHELPRDDEPLQRDVTSFARDAAPPAQRYETFEEEWDALSSSSVKGEGHDEHEDFGEFKPERDNMVVQRSYSAVSVDSGRDSPPVLSADESGESKTPLRVADRVAVNPKGSGLADPQAELIKELSERLKGMKGAEE
jgi:hypothetical protein